MFTYFAFTVLTFELYQHGHAVREEKQPVWYPDEEPWVKLDVLPAPGVCELANPAFQYNLAPGHASILIPRSSSRSSSVSRSSNPARMNLPRIHDRRSSGVDADGTQLQFIWDGSTSSSWGPSTKSTAPATISAAEFARASAATSRSERIGSAHLQGTLLQTLQTSSIFISHLHREDSTFLPQVLQCHGLNTRTDHPSLSRRSTSYNDDPAWSET